jgi:phosphate transport system substrate-binding protein
LKTRQGRCINSEKCPLSREEEIFTIEDGSLFECPLCGGGLIEFVPEMPEAATREAIPADKQSVAVEIAEADEATGPEFEATAEWSPAQETLELPQPGDLAKPVQAGPQTPEILPPAAKWEVPAEAHASWGPEVEPEPEPQTEEYWQKAQAKRADEGPNPTLQTVAPIDREQWDTDSSEVEGAPVVVAPPPPQKTEKAPPVILVAAVLVVLLIAAGFYAVTHKLIVLPGLSLDSKGGQTILRISGSSLMGESLMPAMAEAFLKYRGATGVHTVAGEHPGERIVLGTLPRDVTASQIVIVAHGTASVFACLADNGCEIAMAERRISADEASRMSAQSGRYAPVQERVLGLDGIAVIVNAANPMNTMPEDQVRQFFTGETTNMATANSPIGPVVVYAPDEKSSAWEMFSMEVLGGRPLAAGAKRFSTGSAVSDAVAEDPFGIAFVEFPFVRNAKAIAVSDKDSIPLLPTRLTVATEDYPMARRIYLYTAANTSNPYSGQFASFAMSQMGQEAVRAAGFVGQNVEPLSAPVDLAAPEEYRKLTANAQRLSVDFRFLPDSTVLDSKGLADLDRVVAAISELRLSGEQLMLFGFSDNAGNRDSGQGLSLALAKAVQNQLIQKGIPPSIVNGYGGALPIASSETAEGRRRNRRVEVWVKE